MDRAAELAAKLDRIRAWLEEQDVDGLLLASENDFSWVTAGGDAHVAFGDGAGVGSVLVGRAGAWLLSDNIERARLVDEELPGLALDAVEWPWPDADGRARAVAELCGGGRVVADLPGLGWPAAEGFARLRQTFLPPEIERYRALGRDAAAALEEACRQARRGERELDVAARLSYECRCRGMIDVVNLVGADARASRYRHFVPTSRPVEHTLIASVTARRHGLHASATRMVRLGADSPAGTDTRHRAVVRVDATAILRSRPGVALGEVVRAAVERYASEGFAGEWHLHHQGGLTGYAGREVFATPETGQRLEVDQAVAWNPSITGVKSEDTVLVTAAGPEILTRTGSWPERDVEVEEGVLGRPAILRL